LEGFLRYNWLEEGDPGVLDSSLKGYRNFRVSPFGRLSGGHPGKEDVSLLVPGMVKAKEFPARNSIRKTYV
jgi:hypothetical protein